MFFGTIVKPGEPQALRHESCSADLLHLSQACLQTTVDNSKNFLMVKTEGGTFALCCLQKDKTEHTTVDLFVPVGDEVSFFVKGKSEIHLTGYYEPDMPVEDSDDEDDLAMVSTGGDMSPQAESGSDEEKNEDDDDDDDDDEELPQEKDSSEESDEDDEDSDKEEKPAKKVVAAPPAKKEKRKLEPDAAETGDKKKKVKAASGAAVAAPAPKPAKADKKGEGEKKAEGDKKTEGKEAAYVKSVVDFLKKNGRTHISTVGSKVKKPEGFKTKIGSFLKSHKEFEVNGEMVSLAK